MAKTEPTELLIEREKTNRTYFEETMGTVKSIGSILVNSPMIQALVLVCLVEILQNVKYKDGRPFLDSNQADLLQNVTLITEGIRSVGQTAGSILSLVNPFD